MLSSVPAAAGAVLVSAAEDGFAEVSDAFELLHPVNSDPAIAAASTIDKNFFFIKLPPLIVMKKGFSPYQ
jgi:hypothetical protein